MEDDLRYLIIQEIEQYPCLWDKSNDQYKDQLTKMKAWMDLAELCSTAAKKYSVKEVQTIWKNLRDRANRIDKKRTAIKPTGSAATDDDQEFSILDDDVDGKEWKFWSSLQFLFGRPAFSNERACSLSMFKNRSSISPSLDTIVRGTTISSSGQTSPLSPVHEDEHIFVPEDEHSYLSSAMQCRRNFSHVSALSTKFRPKSGSRSDNPSPDSACEDHHQSTSSSGRNSRASTSRSTDICAPMSGKKGPDKKRKQEVPPAADEILAKLISDEFTIFGSSVADALRRASTTNKAAAKKFRLDVMQLMLDLEGST